MTEDIVIGGDAQDIPAGTYPATLDTIETRTSDAFGEFRVWTFNMDNGSVVSGASSMNTGSKSKGGRWIAALLKRKPTKGEKIQLSGMKCLVVVQEDDNGWPKVTDVLPTLGDVAMAVARGAPAQLHDDDLPLSAPVAPGQKDLPF